MQRENERERERKREREREKNRKEKEKKRENEGTVQGQRQETESERERERETDRDRETQTQNFFGACSTSLSGGNQVDGLPPVVHNETDQAASRMTKRASLKYDSSFQVLMIILLNILAKILIYSLFFFCKAA